ncbi:hypothetical protein HYH03_006722 [Edaphochlamys debaryana]|uniref:Uncharacterized protein n=1 Tax=Edaphochlamys debaryana TaxID=47281 RepID=A0A835Y4P0_9CHLO|nr:hypothetical protein HYH03_006722 [Edaphochlamys debaryana]|eukprot:KAG2495112.1 hypothetical protein HYH03_006722 [Edaphochlamys debaryana]
MAARRLLGLIGGGGLAAAAGAYVWAQPTYNATPSAHEPITREQCELLRTVPDGRPVTPEKNPGARAFKDLFTPQEMAALKAELMPISRQYGINLIQPVHAAIYKWQMSYMIRPPPVNMLRVTGRPEHPDQRRPWGYREALDEAALPPQIRACCQRLRSLPGLRLGRLNDVTLNYRHSGFLRLDPHLDPELDGENVFIISVDGAATLTLSPQNYYQVTKALSALSMDERDVVRSESERSWTPHDLDALLPPGAALHLSADARWRWLHGSRLGVEAPAPGPGLASVGASGPGPASGSAAALAGVPAGQGSRGQGAEGKEAGRGRGGAGAGPGRPPTQMLHWWGRPDDLYGPTPERLSIVFAFSAPDDPSVDPGWRPPAAK